MTNHHDDEFDDIIEGGYHNSPYGMPTGIPAHSIPVKPGLTKRGKVAIAVASVAVAGTGFFWYQAHTAQVAKDEKEAAALEIQMKKLELEELRIRNDEKVKTSQAETAAREAVQARIDKCVKDSEDLIGKGYGSPSKSDVIADCQQQYSGAADGSDMAAAGSATTTGNGGGGINSAALLGLVAGGGLIVAVAANRGKRSHTQ